MTIPQYIMAAFMAHAILKAIYNHGEICKPIKPEYSALQAVVQIIVLAYQDFWHWGVPQFIIALFYFVGVPACFQDNSAREVNAYRTIVAWGIFIAILDLGGFWS